MDQAIGRRTFLLMTGATAAGVALHAAAAPVSPVRKDSLSLAGEWRFALDRGDLGQTNGWFRTNLPSQNRIRLPGILQTQGFGDEITPDTAFIASLPRDMRWYLLPQYKAYTVPGHIKVPYLSQPVRHYLGVAWYQREIRIPEAWRDKRVQLTLERTRWQTDVYLDGVLAGGNRSLVAPHVFELGVLRPGRHLLSLRVDNRMQDPPYRPDGHSVSDALGATWNGVVGRIALSATSPVWIDDVQVYPDLEGKCAHVDVRIGNITGAADRGHLSVGDIVQLVEWTREGGEARIKVPLPNAKPWSEFTPELQNITVSLAGPDANDQREITFGMREIRAEGRQILLNGEVLNIRSTHNGGGFPLTGYPPTDVETWKHIIGLCKTWGLNGMRFHSWCPPDAAFVAADEMGFYLQPECGMWNSFDPEGKMLDVLNDETRRLTRAYGNHPSFVMLGATNEPAGHYDEALPHWDAYWRQADRRRLYTDGVGRFAKAPEGPGKPFAADYLVTPRARGPAGWFGNDYESALRSQIGEIDIPCLSHETGQWCAYPDFAVIDRFLGNGPYAAYPRGLDGNAAPYLVPGNYEIMRDTARAHGLLSRNAELAHASGRFQVLCYKEEIEANLRTPGYSGFQLLDLHDYLGQGGALIGLLDAFWEEKGYVGPAEFRQYCGATVPLARLKQRVFTTSDTLSAPLELAHFGPAPLSAVTPAWRVVDAAGRTVVDGHFEAMDVPRGKNIALGTIEVTLSRLTAPAAYELIVELADTNARNSWAFWVYPPSTAPSVPAAVTVTASWPEAKAALAAGGEVLFLSGKPDKPDPDLALTSVPVFWNRLMNANRTWMLGLWCDTTHGALADFPTQASCDWQWTDVLSATTAMNVEALPETLVPIVQPIDDWNRGLRLAMLFECAVGRGRLMVTSLDLSDTARHPGGMALRRSVLNYMASEGFKPKLQVSDHDMEAWLNGRYRAPVVSITPPAATPDLVDPGQVQRASSAGQG